MDDIIITPTLNTTVINTISSSPTYTTVSSIPTLESSYNYTYNYTYTFPSLNTTYYPSGYIQTPSGNTGTNYIPPPQGSTGTNQNIMNDPISTVFTPIIYTGYTGTNCRHTCSCCIPRYMNENPHIGTKIIPKNAEDAITFENIQDGDILIDFKRNDNKSEYDCGAFYKESTLKFILQSNKNQFTMEQLDKSSIVKYTAVIE
jgi:hypothetical protein